MHFQVKMLDNARKNIFSDKQTKNNVPLMFLDVKVLPKGNNCNCGRFQETSKIKCMSLALEPQNKK